MAESAKTIAMESLFLLTGHVVQFVGAISLIESFKRPKSKESGERTSNFQSICDILNVR